jgi:hypothetical protein
MHLSRDVMCAVRVELCCIRVDGTKAAAAELLGQIIGLRLDRESQFLDFMRSNIEKGLFFEASE